MRKWHRWLAIVFGSFLLWISATGVLSQIGSLVNKAYQQILATGRVQKSLAAARHELAVRHATEAVNLEPFRETSAPKR